jgi:hypothetical protein
MIELPVHEPLTNAIWQRLIELSALQPVGWTLVGAQMVALHGHEQGRKPPRGTSDADVLVNVRAVQDATERFSRMLVAQDFQLDGVSPEGIGHRFTDGTVKIDVLAPDGLDRRRARLTTIPPARTVSVPGGTQALGRTQLVDVRLGGLRGQIPRPDLLGAILLKARAVDVDDVPDAQREDLAFLLTLISDPRALATQLRGKERSWLRRRKNLLERGAQPWWRLPDEEADNGHIAFRIIAGL